jgi:hypothetical protein
LKSDLFGWSGVGLFSALISVIGTENFVRGAMILAGVLTVGVISWAVRAKW